MSQPLKTFICYAREDRDAVDDLRKHLRQAEKKQILEIWDDGEILAGQDWDKAIQIRLETAQLILMLVSVDFINSDYIEKIELQAALQRHRDGEATLIPVIVRRCDWQEHFGIGKFQALPKEARPIKSVELSIREEVYYEVAQGIKSVAQEMQIKIDLVAERNVAEMAAKQAAEEAAARKSAEAKRLKTKDTAAWKAALELNTPEAYEDYLEKYSLHETEAHERIGKLEEVEAKRRAEQKAKDKAEAARKAKEAELAAEAQRAKTAAAKALAVKEAARLAAEALAKEDPFHRLMIPVKGGSFDMGDNSSEAYDDEKPVLRVTVRDFHLCKYPVTQALWKAIVGDNPSSFTGDDRLPVETVSWDDTQAFLKKLNEKTGKKYRLPTEAEWEYAARGGTLSKGFKYSGSNQLEEVAWFDANSDSKTHPVGQKNPNELGLYDMSGNVWEWVADDWHSSYKGAPDNGSAWVDNPRGILRVTRGGYWGDYPQGCRSACRGLNGPDDRDDNLGFRLALQSVG